MSKPALDIPRMDAAIDKAVDRTMRDAAGVSRRIVPVRSRQLKRSISVGKHFKTRQSPGIRGRIISTRSLVALWYGRYTDEGTKRVKARRWSPDIDDTARAAAENVADAIVKNI